VFSVAARGDRFSHGSWWWRNDNGKKRELKKEISSSKVEEIMQSEKRWVAWEMR